MKKEDMPKSLPKIDSKSREQNVDRQAYLFVELNRLIRKRIKEDRMTTVDVLGVLRLAETKLAIDSLRPETSTGVDGKDDAHSEEAPSYFG